MTASLTSPHRRRRWVLAPVIAALAVGAVASGAGIGSADSEPRAAIIHHAWRVHNFTDQTLTAGEFHRDQGADVGSALAFGGTTPWAALNPGDVTGDAFQPNGYVLNEVRTWGRVCYLGQVWNMPRVETNSSLWDNMYVFAMDDGHGGKKLMVTRESGGKNIDMNTYGETC